MGELTDELREAFEARGYDVGEVSDNRGRVRVVLFAEGANADELRSAVYGVVDEGDTIGLNVTTEAIDGRDTLGTVVSFRHRP